MQRQDKNNILFLESLFFYGENGLHTVSSEEMEVCDQKISTVWCSLFLTQAVGRHERLGFSNEMQLLL